MKKLVLPVLIVMMTIFSVTHSVAAEVHPDDETTTQSQNNKDDAYFLSIGLVGGRFICDGEQSSICASGKYLGTVGETFAKNNVSNNMPWTIENKDYSMDIYIFSKDAMSMQDISAIYARGIKANCILPEKEDNMQLVMTFGQRKDTGEHESTIFSLPMRSKDTAGNLCFSRVTLYDLRFCHAYAIVDITKPADSPADIDSIFNNTSFSSGNSCFEGNTPLTLKQMDKDGDGYEIIMSTCERLKNQAQEDDKERFQAIIEYLDELLETYNNAFGYYPASTPKGKAAREQKNRSQIQSLKDRIKKSKE